MSSLFLRRFFSLCLLSGLMLVLPGCDSDEDDDDDPGELTSGQATFSLTGNGVNSSQNWNTYFATGTDPETGGNVFAIYFFPGENFDGSESEFAYVARLSTRPGVGTYDVANIETDDENALADNFGLFGIERVSSQSFRAYYSNGGSLQITSSSDDRVTGSFDIDGTHISFSSGDDEPRQVSIDISGSFNARSGSFIIPQSPLGVGPGGVLDLPTADF